MRADTKASIVLALTSVGLGFVVTMSHGVQPAVLAVGGVGAGCLAVVTAVLLVAVRPAHISTVSSEGWSRWTTLEPEALLTYMRTDRRAEKIAFMSRLVDVKFRRLRLGIDFILAGVSMLFVAAVLRLAL